MIILVGSPPIIFLETAMLNSPPSEGWQAKPDGVVSLGTPHLERSA
ncbi:MAG: hypothetical protein FWE47_02300 [Oscillospiraceae bacterium]|nr:hypothetical protein [Oscillospiraceae bacterium]